MRPLHSNSTHRTFSSVTLRSDKHLFHTIVTSSHLISDQQRRSKHLFKAVATCEATCASLIRSCRILCSSHLQCISDSFIVVLCSVVQVQDLRDRPSPLPADLKRTSPLNLDLSFGSRKRLIDTACCAAELCRPLQKSHITCLLICNAPNPQRVQVTERSDRWDLTKLTACT